MVHALLFFRPIGDQPQQYSFIDQTPLLKPRPLNRYILEPPLLPDPPKTPPQVITGRFFALVVDGTPSLTRVNACGFERGRCQRPKSR